MFLELALATALSAANPALGLLETAKEQLARHDDVSARKTLERALPYAAEDRLLLGRLYLVLGLAWAEGAYEQRAIEAFGTALKLDRQLTLPAGTSPKVQDWWKRVGGTVAEPGPEPEPKVEPVPEPVEPKPSEPPPAEPQPKAEVKPEPVPEPVPAAVIAPQGVETVRRSRAWWAVLPAGAGLVCLGITGVTWKLSSDRHQELARGTRPLMPNEAEGLYTSGQSLQTAAQLSATIAALFAIAAVAVVAVLVREN